MGCVMKQKKGFTLIELLGAIIIIGILLLIAVPAVQNYLKRGKKSYYTSIEGEMKAAGMDYLETYRSLLPKVNGGITIVSLKELVENKYMDSVNDEEGKPCTGQVAIKRLKNKNYEYYSCLICGEDGKFYKTSKELKDANGDVVNVCDATEANNPSPYIGEYVIDDICTTTNNCDVKNCTDNNNCNDPNPPMCDDSQDCKLKLESERIIVVEQGIGKLKLPYATVKYGDNIIKTGLLPSPYMIDISQLGIYKAKYRYGNVEQTLTIKVVDRKNPKKPEIALRKDTIFGKTYLPVTWYSGNIFASFRSTDYETTGLMGSGIKEYYVYPEAEEKVSAPTSVNQFVKVIPPFEIVTQEGKYTRYIISKDNAGNVSNINQYNYQIDKTKPYPPTITILGTPSSYGWYNGTATFKVTDNGDNCTNVTSCNDVSGVGGITYSLNGATIRNDTNVPSGSLISVTNNNITKISALVYDNANNKSSVVTSEIKMDKEPPTRPTLTVVGSPQGGNNWYREDVTVRITSGTDQDYLSGVDRVVYTKIGAENIAETAIPSGNTVNITTEGTTTLSATTIDKAGNRSGNATLGLNIDKTPPAAPIIQVLSSPVYGGWYKGAVNFTVTGGADALSGIYKVKYSVSNGGTVVVGEQKVNSGSTGTIPASVSGSNIVITAYTIDKAGNISTASTVTIAMDNTAPTCDGDYSGQTTVWHNSDLTITHICNDSLSGCVSNPQQTFTTSTSTATFGGHTIIDNVGNTNYCVAKTVNVYIDKTAPSATTITGCGTSSEDPITISFAASDSHSGVNSYVYTIDGSEPSIYSSRIWAPYSNGAASIPITATGTYNIRVRAVDGVSLLGSVNNSGTCYVVKQEPPSYVNSGTEQKGIASHTHTGSAAGSEDVGGRNGCWDCDTCPNVHGGSSTLTAAGKDPTSGKEYYTCNTCGLKGFFDYYTGPQKHCKKGHAPYLACGKTPKKAKIQMQVATNVTPHRVRFIVSDGSITSVSVTSGSATAVSTTEFKLNSTNTLYKFEVNYKSGTNSSTTGIKASTTPLKFEYQN